MAKRPKLDDDLFGSNVEEKPASAASDPVKPTAVGIKQSEVDRLDEIAEELNTNRHQVLLFAVRNFLKRYDEGERPPTKTKTMLDM